MEEIRDEFFDFIDLNNEDPFSNTFSFDNITVKEEQADLMDTFLINNVN